MTNLPSSITKIKLNIKTEDIIHKLIKIPYGCIIIDKDHKEIII